MLPIRDNIPATRTPLVTVGLIALNGAVFLGCAAMAPEDLQRFFFTYGFVPAKLFHPEVIQQHYFGAPDRYSITESVLPIFTCMFLHSGWFHIIGNMWILWIFGDNVEDTLGHVGFLAFYLACGLLAGVAHWIAASASPIPTVGASGAIAGVMGAYLVLYPRARVMTLIPLFPFVFFEPLPAFFFLFFWFAIQFVSGLEQVGFAAAASGGVAWWAHIGGFAVGAAFVLLAGIRPARRPLRPYARTRRYCVPRRRTYTRRTRTPRRWF